MKDVGFVIQMLYNIPTFVSCVHPMQALRAAFCMTCSLLMLVGDTIATIWMRHTPESVS